MTARVRITPLAVLTISLSLIGVGLFFSVMNLARLNWAERLTIAVWLAALVTVSIILLVVAIRRRTVERALRESEARFRATFNQAAVGLVHVDMNGHLIRANPRFCEIVGHSPDELQNISFVNLTHPEDLPRDLQLRQQTLAGKQDTFTLDKRYLRKDGTPVWTTITGSLVRDQANQPNYFIIAVEDIGARKRMQEDRDLLLQREQAARAQAEAANRAKDQFLAIISHELRTPLTPVLAAVGLLKRDPQLSHDEHNMLEMIHRNIELESRIISDLLDVVAINNQRMELRMVPLDMHGVLRHAYEIHQDAIRAKQIRMSVQLVAPHHAVRGDQSRLMQVFWNILGNAIKFTPSNGLISMTTDNPTPDIIRIRISDTGVGMDAAMMDRLFKPFEQGERTLTRRFGGLGLGLSLSKSLVESHSGTLTASSPGNNQGATFTIELPTIPAPVSTVPTPLPLEKLSPVRPLTILVVEDNPDTQRALAKLLRNLGHTVLTARHAQEALDIAAKQHFDMLLSDIGLPDFSGWELMRQLRTKRPIPGIAFSGFSSPEDYQHSREAGFTEHLVKPVNVQKLHNLIQQVADGEGLGVRG